MDLTSLKEILEAEKADGHSVKLADAQETTAPSEGLVEEILSRFRGKADPESQQICVILSATVEVIQAKGLQATSTSLFAALISTLGDANRRPDEETTSAMCLLLSIVLSRVPRRILESRSTHSIKIITSIMEAAHRKEPVFKHALPCLSHFLAAMGPGDWPGASRGFAVVLTACLDQQPRVRKRAHSSLVDIFASLQGVPPVLAEASNAMLKLCQRVLPSPEQAAHVAARASAKQRQQAEDGIAAAVEDALHLLVVLRQTIFLFTGPVIQAICGLILQLYPLKQPLLSRHATDTIAALASSSAAHVSPSLLENLVSAILSFEDIAWDKRDAESTLVTIKFIEDATLRISSTDPSLNLSVLPRSTHALVQLLAAPHDGVRRAASMALRNLLASCVTVDLLDEISKKNDRNPSALQRVIAGIESALGPRHCDAWELALPVAGELMEWLGRRSSSLATGLLLRIGELCAGGDDLLAQLSEYGGSAEDEERIMMAAQDALGVALRAFGPEFVLRILPLRIEEGFAGDDESRTWMIPLLKLHVRGARVEYWLDELLPLAKDLGLRGASARCDANRHREAQICSALEAQIWATLPAFCSWSEDIGATFGRLSKALAPAFEKRQDLRGPICNAIRRIATQTRFAFKMSGKMLGFAEPSNLVESEELASSGDHGLYGDHDAIHNEMPEYYRLETAEKSVEALRSSSRAWLTLLLNSFVNAPANRRAPIQAAISAYSCVCESSTTAILFRLAMKKFMKASEQARTGELGREAVLEGGDTDSERCSTFIEAALSLAGGLEASGIEVLYKAAVPGIKQKDPSRQKKSYKVIAYVLESRPDFYQDRFQGIVSTLLEGGSTAVSASKRYRLRCIKAMVMLLLEADGPSFDISALPSSINEAIQPFQQNISESSSNPKVQAAFSVVAPMATEMILCLKESNKRTRTAAYDLLVAIARGLHDADPPASSSPGLKTSGGGLQTLVKLVLAGLVGSTSHMISASVMALARLLYEFSPVLSSLVPGLMPAVLMLLRSKAREVIKSVLGFVKVVAMRMPVPDLLNFLPSICEGMLVWAEDSKNKFRSKVRMILERLARRCGFDALEAAIPESHRALFTHIRKQNNRRERKKNEWASQMDWDEGDDAEDSRTHRSTRTARTLAASAWHSDIFDDEHDDTGTIRTFDRRTLGKKSIAPTAATLRRQGRIVGGLVGTRSARSLSLHARRRLARLPSGEDPVDLLDLRTSRAMMRAAAGHEDSKKHDVDDHFERGEDGRIIIEDEEEDTSGKRKRTEARDAGFDSDDSDFEDLKGFTGLSLALRGTTSVAASSVARSMGEKSKKSLSVGGKSSRREDKAQNSKQRAQKSQYTGERFRAKKGGAQGDVKGKSKLEPFAYWPLDRNLMNRRASKARGARQGLDKIVTAAMSGAAKGRKAKRMKLS